MAEVLVSFFPSLVCSPSVVLVASIVYYQLSEVYPGEWHFNAACAHARTHAHCCRTDNIPQAITMIPNPLPANLVDHPLYPALTTAVRDLATSNIMTAVMLTGLILLQVCRASYSYFSSCHTLILKSSRRHKAGRYYAKRPASPPITTENSSVSTPASASSPSSPETHPIPVSQRSATPFRELTEDELLELDSGKEEPVTATTKTH